MNPDSFLVKVLKDIIISNSMETTKDKGNSFSVYTEQMSIHRKMFPERHVDWPLSGSIDPMDSHWIPMNFQ